MLFLALTTLLAADRPACPAELFRIERSKNANAVVYEAKPGRAAALDPSEPVTATWLMLSAKGEREPLNFLERSFAYGFEIHPGADGYLLTLVSLKERVIKISARAACPTATTAIGGRTGVLKRIFVKAEDRGLFPAVASVELFGIDPETGDALYEKIIPGAGPSNAAALAPGKGSGPRVLTGQ